MKQCKYYNKENGFCYDQDCFCDVDGNGDMCSWMIDMLDDDDKFNEECEKVYKNTRKYLDEIDENE